MGDTWHMQLISTLNYWMKNTHITPCDSGIRSGQILLLLAKGFCKTYKAKSGYSVIFAVS